MCLAQETFFKWTIPGLDSPFKPGILSDSLNFPYDYTVEVTNRFKGLDLTESLKNYGWRFMVTLYRKEHPQEKEMQKGKMLSEEALQIAEKRKDVKRK